MLSPSFHYLAIQIKESEKKTELDKSNNQILEGISPRSLHKNSTAIKELYEPNIQIVEGISPLSLYDSDLAMKDVDEPINPEGISPLSLLSGYSNIKQNDEAKNQIKSVHYHYMRIRFYSIIQILICVVECDFSYPILFKSG
jgi:hypothetical protein